MVDRTRYCVRLLSGSQPKGCAGSNPASSANRPVAERIRHPPPKRAHSGSDLLNRVYAGSNPARASNLRPMMACGDVNKDERVHMLITQRRRPARGFESRQTFVLLCQRQTSWLLPNGCRFESCTAHHFLTSVASNNPR